MEDKLSIEQLKEDYSLINNDIIHSIDSLKRLLVDVSLNKYEYNADIQSG